MVMTRDVEDGQMKFKAVTHDSPCFSSLDLDITFIFYFLYNICVIYILVQHFYTYKIKHYALS